MKQILRPLCRALLLAGLPLAAFAQTPGVGIGTTAPNASAALDIVSTNKGALLPRLTQAQRNAIAAPAAGLLVFQTDGTTKGFWYNSGGTGVSPSPAIRWVRLTDSNGLSYDPVTGLQVGPGPVGTPTVTTVGTGTATFGPPLYNGLFSDSRHQFLYRAADLTAAGLTAGPIVSVAFFLPTKSSTIPYQNFTIKMGNTAATSATGNFATSGATTVYTATYTTAVGWNTHTFQTPFVWDGTSNIVLETCHDNAAANVDDYNHYTTTSYTGTYGLYKNSDAGCSMTSATSGVGLGTFNGIPNARFTQNGSYTLPASAGIAGQVLTQQANGSVTFQTPQWTQNGTNLYPSQIGSNVGVGTATPTAALDVAGSTRLRGLTTAGFVTTDANGNLSSAAATSFGTNFIQNQNAADQAANFRINGNGSLLGNIGVGTATPSQKVDVRTAANDNGVLLSNTGANNSIGLRSNNNGPYLGLNNAAIGTGSNTAWIQQRPATDVNPNHLNYNNTSGSTHAFTSQAVGGAQVGINTTTPTATLDVDGTARVRSLTTAGIVTTDASGNLSSGTAASLDATTASNGLTETGNDIRLGGTLTQATTVSGITATNSLELSGTAAPLITNTTGATAANNRVLALKTNYANTIVGSGAHLSFLDGGNTEFGRIASIDEGGAGGFIGMGFSTNNGGTSLGERMRINAAGNVGIGTTTPLTRLSITPNDTEAKITLWDSGNANNHYGFGVSNFQLNYHVQNASDRHVFYAGGKNGNGTELLRIQGNGRVGIGTIAPTATLDVNGTTRLRGLTTAGIVTTDAAGNLSSGTAASLDATTASNGLTETGNDIRLGGTLTQATTIDQGANNLSFTGTTGNIGIGATSAARLHVRGRGNAWPATTGTTQSVGLISRFQTIDNAILDIGGNSGFGAWLQSTDITALNLNYPLLLNPNGGNVGIGTTSPQARLEVVGGAAINDATPVNSTQTQARLYRPGTTNQSWGATAEFALGRYAVDTNTDAQFTQLDFKLGRDNNTLADQTVMTLRADQRVGINTTTPTATLDVNGAARLRGLTTAGIVTTDANGNLSSSTAASFGTNFIQNQNAADQAANFRISGNGSVLGSMGIGTATPTDRLHIASPSSLRGRVETTSNGFAGWLSKSALAEYFAGVNTSTADYTIYDNLGAASRLSILGTSGNVGIGTAAPTARLDVDGTARVRSLTTAGIVTTDALGNLSSGTAASLDATTASNGLTEVGNDIRLGGTLTQATNVAQGGNNLSFTGGNVGFGLATPSAAMHLYGGSNGGFAPANGQGAFMFGNGGVTRAASIQTLDDGNFGGGLFFNVHATTGADNWPTGTTTALTLRPNAFVGVGTTTPNSRLSITPTATEAKITLWDGGSTSTHYGFGISNSQMNYHVDNAAASHVFYQGGKNGNGTELMRVAGNGRVGIGTSAPELGLDVANGTIGLRNPLANWDHLYLNHDGGTAFLNAGGAETGLALRVSNTNTGSYGTQAYTEAMRLMPTGRVGIGTANPGARLDVQGGSIIVGGFNSINSQGAHLQWNRSNGEGETWLINQLGGGNANAGIRFGGSNTSNGVTEWARFNNNGNMGLGVTAPAAKLDVASPDVATVPAIKVSSGTMVYSTATQAASTTNITLTPTAMVHKFTNNANATANGTITISTAGVQEGQMVIIANMDTEQLNVNYAGGTFTIVQHASGRFLFLDGAWRREF